jgi:PAS domain S-box-containing protein
MRGNSRSPRATKTRPRAHPGNSVGRRDGQAALHGREQERLLHELQEAREIIEAQSASLSEMQSQVEEARDRYADLFDFAPIAYALLDSNGVVREINLTGCRLLGVNRAYLLERPLIGMVIAEDRRGFLDHLRRCRNGTDRVESELRLATRMGETVPTQFSSQAVRAGQELHFRTAIIDLRERLRLELERLESRLEVAQVRHEEQLARRDKEAKDHWLAVLSHELRTPLTPVVFAISNLLRLPDLPDDARRLLNVIKRNSEVEMHLIDDLLDMNRISLGKLLLNPGRLDLHDLVMNVLEGWGAQAASKGVTIVTDLQASAHVVDADASRLRQVIWNLTTNAVKFTSEGGRVVIRTRNTTPATIALLVTDTGIGFDPVQSGRLFEPFEQGGHRGAGLSGLGLGLTIARGIVEAHGGRVSAQSDGPGQGATFQVELPLKRPEPR